MAVGHHRGALGAGRVEHRQHLARLLFERRQLSQVERIREARPSHVEADQAAERCQAIEHPSEGRQLPSQLNVGRAKRQEHEVQRAVANNLIGDIRAIIGLGVASVGDISHQSPPSILPNRLDRCPDGPTSNAGSALCHRVQIARSGAFTRHRTPRGRPPRAARRSMNESTRRVPPPRQEADA